MPTMQASSGETEAAGIEQTIQSVESLYRAVTGKNPPPADDDTFAPIPVEKNPGQFVEEQLDRLLSALEQQSAAAFEWTWCPLLTVVETENELVVSLDLPGVERRDVQVTAEGNVLGVRGRRVTVEAVDGGQEKGRNVRLNERPTGAFFRRVLLSPAVRWGEPRARLADGVLEIRIGKEPAGDAGARPVAVS
ncbi:MAG TPA: Hsp20/alpha crystallin family protein [Thermoanaerobaculia bacterium]|nr:Hsp20/alpha crystallin family protein [Thermoanaerobaculia bacterium]